MDESLTKNFNKYEKKLVDFIKNYPFPIGIKIYLYGSRARRDHDESSDLDLAFENLPEKFHLFDFEEELDKQNIPYHTDLTNLKNCSEDFKKQFYEHCILIHET